MSDGRLETLENGSTGDLGTLTTEVSNEAIALFQSAVDASEGVTASIALREYARLLWANYEERLAVTTAYRTRIVRPLVAGAVRVDGFLLSSVNANGRWRLEVLTEISSADALVASNRTQLLVTAPRGATPAARQSSQATATALDFDQSVLRELLSRERIVSLEAATGAIWPEHAVENIHTRSDAAQATGISTRRFASGMLTTGLIVKWLAVTDKDWYEAYELDVTFLRPAAEGSVLHVGDFGSGPNGHRVVGCVADDILVARATLVPIDAGVPRPGEAGRWR